MLVGDLADQMSLISYYLAIEASRTFDGMVSLHERKSTSSITASQGL